MHATKTGLAAAISVALAFGQLFGQQRQSGTDAFNRASSSEIDGALNTMQAVLDRPAKGTFNLKLNGKNVQLITGPLDFRLSFLLGTRAPFEPVNRWNAQHSLARAYVYGQGTHLEADLDVAGGVTRRSAQVFLTRFGNMTRQFMAEFANLAPVAVSSNKTKMSLLKLQGDGYALISTDPVGGANVRDALNKNLPEINLTLDAKRTVSSHERTVHGAAVRYLSFSYTRPSSATIHLVADSAVETFDKNKAAFLALIDGLEITDPPVDGSSAAGRISLRSGKQSFIMLKSSAGEAYAMMIWEGLAFANLQQQDAEPTVAAEQLVTINGRKMAEWNVQATIRELNSYRNYYWATQTEITKYEVVSAEFSKGLHVTE